MNNALYNQIRIFQTIAAEGSITAAARKLQITAPSVSKALKTLEQHLGLPLFSRSTRHIELTEAGRRLLARSGDAVQALQDAIESVRDDNAIPSGLVRVTLSRFAYQLIFRPFIAEFGARYPHIQLELSLCDGIINILDAGYDLGIRFGDTLEEGMVARRLLSPFAEGLYAAPEYLARHGTPQTPDDLARHRLIGYRYITANRLLPLTLDADGEPLGVAMPTPLICNDIDVTADAIRAGLSIGRLFAP
ncbi:MAG: LysR family transcriptional regulator, partial [Cardiobacterium sp.]